MKVKGVDVSKLTKSQQKAMKKHSVHHTKKHMQYMYGSDFFNKGFRAKFNRLLHKHASPWHGVSCAAPKDYLIEVRSFLHTAFYV